MKAKESEEMVADERDAEEFAREVATWTWDLKALNAVVIDLRGVVSYTDFVVVCTGTSERQVQAIARHVEEKAKDGWGAMPLGREGTSSGQWALIDFGDVILHIFHGSVREDYDLERMWPEAPRLELEEAPTVLYGHFELQELG